MEITWQNVVLGALAAGGTTALGILVTRLVNRVLDWRSQLIVEIRVNDMINVKNLWSDLRDQIRSVITKWEDREKLPIGFNDKIAEFFDSDCYLKLTITNNARKKLTGVTMSLDRVGTSMMQIGHSGNLVEIPGKTPTAIADLQPGRTITIDLLTRTLFSTATDQALKGAIVFSSDEHVRVRIDSRHRTTWNLG